MPVCLLKGLIGRTNSGGTFFATSLTNVGCLVEDAGSLVILPHRGYQSEFIQSINSFASLDRLSLLRLCPYILYENLGSPNFHRTLCIKMGKTFGHIVHESSVI